MRGTYGKDRLCRDKGREVMVARKYYPGTLCADCNKEWTGTDRPWSRDRCNRCFQGLLRREKGKMPRKVYERKAPTEDAYITRIHHIAEVNVPDELRDKFIHTFLVTHNPFRKEGGTHVDSRR